MIPVCICGGCGRTIEKEFVYCPWCGVSKISAMSEDDKMEQIFNRLEKIQKESRDEKIEKMNSKLDDLKRELDSMVLCSEMHK